MSQVGKPIRNKQVKERIDDVFYQAVAEINSKEKAKEFFDAVLTPTEKTNLPKRLGVYILLAKEWSYKNIADALHISSATIGRIREKIITTGTQGVEWFVKKILHQDLPNKTTPTHKPPKKYWPKESAKKPFRELPY